MKKLVGIFTAVALLSFSTSAVAQNGPRASRAGQRMSTEAWIAAGIGIAAAVAVILLLPEGDNSSHAH